MFLIIPGILSAFLLTYFLIPYVIGMSKNRHLFAKPNERSSHLENTPELGGIALFIGIFFSAIIWIALRQFDYLLYIMAALLIVFLIGLRDDIIPVSPLHKILGQTLAVAILILKTDTFFSSLHGWIGIENAPYPILLVLTTLFILFITNAFNLIDGIDGLAGSIGALVLSTYGCWFMAMQKTDYALLAFISLGAILAFLKYNYTPAQIFMGDSGALVIGLISAILTIQFIESHKMAALDQAMHFKNPVVVALGILMIPVFDTLRVFFTRIYRRQHPLKADRRHIHHMLLDLGYSHIQATALLMGTNILFIALVFSLEGYLGMHLLAAGLFGIATLTTYLLHRKLNAQRQKAATTSSGTW